MSPAVVRLRVTGPDGDSRACGVVVRDDGIVVTSAHEVVGATAITVELADGRRVEGTLVGADLPTDVGVITIDAAAWRWRCSAARRTSTRGRHGRHRHHREERRPCRHRRDQRASGSASTRAGESLHGLIQTDAPIEADWSGGPLVDDVGLGDRHHHRPGRRPTRASGSPRPIELVRRLADELLDLRARSPTAGSASRAPT